MMTRPRLSAFVVCHNEEQSLGPCLASLDGVDELLVVDSHSTDKTVEVARKYTDRVVVRDWPGYREQKQWAAEQLKGEWILFLDADERCTPELRREIDRILDSTPSHDAYRIPRRTFYLGRWIRHGGWYPDYCVRLFRRKRGRFGADNPHERWETDGSVGTLRNAITHYSYRNLSEQHRTIDRFSDSAAGELLRRRRTAFPRLRMIIRPIGKFIGCYVLRRGFLDGFPGFIIAVNSAHNVFLRYAKVWEATRLSPDDFPSDFPGGGSSSCRRSDKATFPGSRDAPRASDVGPNRGP